MSVPQSSLARNSAGQAKEGGGGEGDTHLLVVQFFLVRRIPLGAEVHELVKDHAARNPKENKATLGY